MMVVVVFHAPSSFEYVHNKAFSIIFLGTNLIHRLAKDHDLACRTYLCPNLKLFPCEVP